MLIAITGTPGTGKTTTCDVIARRGYTVVDLEEVARRAGCVVGRDESRQTEEVDIELLRERIRVPAKIAFLKAHYSHLLDVNIAIVLRCRPSVLRARLGGRGWPRDKIRENVEAEALDIITQEAVARIPTVAEVDTTNLTAEQSAAQVLEILEGRAEGHEPGRIDWSEEVLSWS